MSTNRKKVIPPIAASSELRTPLLTAFLPLLPPAQPVTPKQAPIRQAIASMKKIQMQNIKRNNDPSNDIAIATTPIQIIKTLKIHKPDFY